MKKWIFVSLLVNIAVLIPVCLGLITEAVWAEEGYGPITPARGILLSIYIAILLISLLLLRNPDPKLVAPLLLVQVIYKFSTPLTVGTLQNPVVLSNLGIAVLHTITLWTIWSSLKGQLVE
ncbi:MAG: hypothetical protein ACO211_03520 [bacterium]|jgi:hypothetical protein